MTPFGTPPDPSGRVDYDGRRFRPVGDGSDASTVGSYHQKDGVVWAEFSGSLVAAGRLVGTCDPQGLIDAAYCMVTGEGGTIAGTCRSTPALLADGRVTLTERWRRMDGSTGVSYLEEIIG
jgi:hypothetical protein